MIPSMRDIPRMRLRATGSIITMWPCQTHFAARHRDQKGGPNESFKITHDIRDRTRGPNCDGAASIVANPTTCRAATTGAATTASRGAT